MKISILGSYQTQFGELWDQGLRELLKEAAFGAIKDAGIKPSQVEAIFVANKAGGGFSNKRHISSLASQMFNHFPPSLRIEAACASGGIALVTAEQAILSGRYKTVLVVGVEKMTDVSSQETTKILTSAADVIHEYGSTFPALYALLAKAHISKYGTTREQLSAVSVKNHRHALDNPQAQFHKKLTIDQVSNSQLVADPLRLLDCSPITDGAAAVVLTSKKSLGKPKILGYGQGQDTLDLASRSSLTELKATQTAAKFAYKEAGVKASQIQVAELHDCFTIAELLATEDLGFVAHGKSGNFALEGKTTYGGKIVINPSGGLKACGHPVGATGVKQLVYISKLIKKDQFKIGLTHNVGGSGATAVVHIVGK